MIAFGSRRRADSRQSYFALADQVASSASNALIVFAVAGTSDTAQLGSFAISFTLVLLLVGLQRNILGIHVSLAAGEPGAVRRETRHALGAALAVAPLVVAFVVVGSFAGTGLLSLPTIVLALTGPVVLLQDLLRYSAVAESMSGKALLADVAWLGFGLVAMGWRFLGEPQPWQLVALWACGAVVSAGILFVSLRMRPAFAGLSAWLLDSWNERAHLSVAGLGIAVSAGVTPIIIARLAGPEVVGALTGAGQLMAPVNLLTAYVAISAVPRAMGLPIDRRRAVFTSLALRIAVLGVLLGAFWWVMNDRIGELLLGETWGATQPLMLLSGAHYALVGVGIAGVALLTAVGRSRSVMVLQSLQGLVRVALVALVAKFLGTATSLVWTDTVAALIFAALFWSAASEAREAASEASSRRAETESPPST